jgi:hypothetical protein
MGERHYNLKMRERLTAGVIALVILVTGVIPAVAGYRCIAMGVRMATPSACCHHGDETPAFKAQCCEVIAAVRIEPRSTPTSQETTIQAPALIGWIVFPPLTVVVPAVDQTTPARARGRPPGERLHRLSTILRV